MAPQAIYGDHKITIVGMCLGAIRRNVNQVADLSGHGRARTGARGFASRTRGMVTELQEVLLSNNLEVRKRDLCVGELATLKSHLAGGQSSVTDAGVEIGSRHSYGKRSDCTTLRPNTEELIARFCDAFLYHRILVWVIDTIDFHRKAILPKDFLAAHRSEAGSGIYRYDGRGPGRGRSLRHSRRRPERIKSRRSSSSKQAAVLVKDVEVSRTTSIS